MISYEGLEGPGVVIGKNPWGEVLVTSGLIIMAKIRESLVKINCQKFLRYFYRPEPLSLALSLYVCICIYVCIHMLDVGGCVRLWSPNREIVSFRACERARRSCLGEREAIRLCC